jgi:hypothetical protein
VPFLSAISLHKLGSNNQYDDQVYSAMEESWRLFCGRAAKKRAFRSKSSDLLMQILWAFRCNPLRPTGFSSFGKGSHRNIP